MAGAAWDASLNKNVKRPSNRKNIKENPERRKCFWESKQKNSARLSVY
jgi:hypothetical protein